MTTDVDSSDRDFGDVHRIGVERAGEILTLQRAAYVTEAKLHNDLQLPPLDQTVDEIVDELRNPEVIALGITSGARLVAAVRLTVHGDTAELGRLTVAPDLQGRGLGSRLLDAVDAWLPSAVARLELFTGEHSLANIRLYNRFGFREFRRRNVGTYDLVFFARSVISGETGG